jgi:hypothetical protein
MPVLHGIPVDCRAVLAIDFWKKASANFATANAVARVRP